MVIWMLCRPNVKTVGKLNRLCWQKKTANYTDEVQPMTRVPFSAGFMQSKAIRRSASHCRSIWNLFSKGWRKTAVLALIRWCMRAKMISWKVWTTFACLITIGWAKRSHVWHTVFAVSAISTFKSKGLRKICTAAFSVALCKSTMAFLRDQC